MAPKPRPVAERFWEKVLVGGPDDCWLWQAAKVTGYGAFTVAYGQQRRAHRVAYELRVGSIPAGLQLDHLCRNRACVNPAHLEPVTMAENMARGAHAKKTQCPRGHPFTPENTYVYSGKRQCRACKIEQAAIWSKAHPERRRIIERRYRAHHGST